VPITGDEWKLIAVIHHPKNHCLRVTPLSSNTQKDRQGPCITAMEGMPTELLESYAAQAPSPNNFFILSISKGQVQFNNGSFHPVPLLIIIKHKKNYIMRYGGNYNQGLCLKPVVTANGCSFALIEVSHFPRKFNTDVIFFALGQHVHLPA
jgi:hypothetical protein